MNETRDIHEGEINSDEAFAFDEDISIQPVSLLLIRATSPRNVNFQAISETIVVS